MKVFPVVVAVLVAVYLIARRTKLGRIEIAIGLLVIAGLGVYASGVIHLPKLEKVIRDAGTALGPYTYLLVGILAFLETGAFVGLIAPGEFAILVGGLVAGQGRISIVALIALVWACAFSGDLVSFLAGRRLGREFLERHGPRVKITHERLERVDEFFAKHGGKAIFLGRFIGLVRAVAPFIAGSSQMPLRRFLPYDILGAGLWGTTYCLLGYVFWQSFDKLTSVAKEGAIALGVIIVVVAGSVYAYRWLRVPDNRGRARAWIDEQLDRPAVRPVVRVASPVVVPVARRLTGPLRFAWDRLTPGDLGLELTALLAVAAVGGFVFGALADTVTGTATAGDMRAFDVAADLRGGFVVSVSKGVSALGMLPVVGAVTGVAAALLAWQRHVIEAAVLVVGYGLVVVASHLAKAAEGRPRPGHALVETSGSSFPSGHATLAAVWVAIAVALARTSRRQSVRAALVIVSLVLAAAIGLSRVELRAHFFTDVLGGWGLGSAVLALCGSFGVVVARLRHNGRAP